MRSKFEDRIRRLEARYRPPDEIDAWLRAVDGSTRCLPSQWMAHREEISAVVHERFERLMARGR